VPAFPHIARLAVPSFHLAKKAGREARLWRFKCWLR
jgi:hypothetical protein